MPHIIDREAEAQRDSTTCPMSHNLSVAERELRLRKSSYRVCELNLTLSTLVGQVGSGEWVIRMFRINGNICKSRLPLSVF